MTQNLRLGSGNSAITLSPETTSMTDNSWVLPSATTTWTVYNNVDDLTPSEAGFAQFLMTTQGEYLYNFAAATAGSNSVQQAINSSICPKGWGMPNSTSNLAASYNIISNSSWDYNNEANYIKWTSNPLDFVALAGSITQRGVLLAEQGGIWQDYGTSQSVAKATFWGYRDFSSSYFLWISNSDNRNRGYSVRCLAQ